MGPSGLAAVSSSVSRPRTSELVSTRNGVISGGGAEAGIERRAARFGGEGLGEALFVGLPHQLEPGVQGGVVADEAGERNEAVAVDATLVDEVVARARTVASAEAPGEPRRAAARSRWGEHRSRLCIRGTRPAPAWRPAVMRTGPSPSR